MKPRYMFVVLIAVSLVGGACTAPQPAPQPTASPLTANVSPLVSPLPAAANVMPFKLDRPLLPGATEVRGTGPAGVPIFIADVTFMGDPLGTGTIGADGEFVVTVYPLADGHRIGLALGILDGTRWKSEDFYLPAYYGPDSMQAPQVGFFHDTVMVGN
jgi:hypothetical protein